jgi:hypothetical protein
LNGLAVRIAQSLGLHRDGDRLGISPFQSEIRRRLWWHLICREGRAGEDYGLEDTNSSSLLSTVKIPANMDDKDLYPEMKRLPVAKEGWTAMMFSLIYIDLTKTMQKLSAIAATSSPSSPPSENVRVQIMNEAKERVENWLEHCNPIIPQQRMTLFCARFQLRKLEFITKLQWILMQHSGLNTEFATEKNLIEALEILGPRLHIEDGLLKQFAWAKKAYPQYHVTLYVLWHLCVKPEGPNVDSAWETVDPSYAPELWDESNPGFGSKSAVLVALKARAVSIRDKIRAQSQGRFVRTGDRSSEQLSREGLADGEDISACSPGDMGGSELDLQGGIVEWPEWEALVQGFNFDRLEE